MFSHQYKNSIGDDLYNGYWYKNPAWKLHYHKGYEFVWVLKGELHATVADKHYLLRQGDALFVTPFALHSYTTDACSELFIAVFAGTHVSKFASATADKEPLNAKFTISSPLSEYLYAQMIALENAPLKSHKLLKKPSPYALKSCLYAVCNEFAATAEWRDKKTNDDLVFKIISYIEQHYTENITLSSMANELSYEYHYISRVLRESLGIRFRTLVNQYRCERAKDMITETDMPLSVIAMTCGFQSIRSFNRIFSEITGATPTDVRKGVSPNQKP
ncbi:MAG: AraC family transcriptional regulator [Clostridia bacterium]|nr:AraC family transcriptional regulator [Clostridia bacterium]